MAQSSASDALHRVIEEMHALAERIRTRPVEIPSMSAIEAIGDAVIRPGPFCLERLRTDAENQVILDRLEHEKRNAHAEVPEHEKRANALKQKKADIHAAMLADETWSDEDLVEYLASLDGQIAEKHTMPAMQQPTDFDMQVHAHQLKAAAIIRARCDGPGRGIILADPPGTGKTVTAILATLIKGASARPGTTLIVTRAICLDHWIDTIDECFQQQPRDILIVEDPSTDPFDLYNHEIVLTSYECLLTERSRLYNYVQGFQDYRDEKSVVLPDLPRLCFTSDVHHLIKRPGRIGKHLILDDAHLFSKHDGPHCDAVESIRPLFDSCVMLTGTPLTSSWLDIYPMVKLLKGHPLTAFHRMYLAFTDQLQVQELDLNKKLEGHFAQRYAQLMDAFFIRRPRQATLDSYITVKHEDVEFLTTNDEHHTMLRAFADFLNAKYVDKRPAQEIQQALDRSMRLAYHPKLQEAMCLEDRIYTEGHTNAKREIILDASMTEALDDWRSSLDDQNAWMSSRVNAVLDLIKENHNLEPDAGIVIMDEHILFLDIIHAAVKQSIQGSYHTCKFNEFMSIRDRLDALDGFRQYSGFKIMLASCVAARNGLDLTSANVLIRCGPWTNDTWVELATARVVNLGQHREARTYELWAEDSNVEIYKRHRKKQKAAILREHLEEITRDDDAQLSQRGREAFIQL